MPLFPLLLISAGNKIYLVVEKLPKRCHMPGFCCEMWMSSQITTTQTVNLMDINMLWSLFYLNIVNRM